MNPVIGRYIALALLLSCWAGCRAPAPTTNPTGMIVTIADEERFVDHALATLRDNFFTPEYVDRSRGVIVSRPETSRQWFEFWRSDAPAGYQLLESSLHTVRRRVTINFVPADQPGARVAGRVESADPVQQQMQPAPRHAQPPRPAQAAPQRARAPTYAAPSQMTPVGGRVSPAPSRPGLTPAPPASRPRISPAPPAAAPAPPAPRPKPYRVTVTVDKERYSAPERQVTTVSGSLAIFSERLPTTEGIRASRGQGEHWIPLGRDGQYEQRLLARLVRTPVVSDQKPLPASAAPSSPAGRTAPPPRPPAPPPPSRVSNPPGQLQLIR